MACTPQKPPAKTQAEQVITAVKAVSDRMAKIESNLAELSKPASKAASGLFAVPKDYEAERRGGFSTPREYLLSVMNAYKGAKLDPRLARYSLKAVGSDEATGANDPYGGFLVPVAFAPDMLKVDPEEDPMAGKTKMVPMERPVVKIPARVDKNHSTSVTGGLIVYRREETVAGTASRIEFEQVTLDAHSLFGVSYATEEILTDAPGTFAALIASSFSEQFTSHMVDERLNGTGVGEFEGVINAPATITVSKETDQDATTLVYQNVLNMRSRCWGYGNAIWLANHDTMPQLMLMNQAVGTGGAVVWQPSAREDHPDILLGRPLIFTEYTKTLGTAGDLVLGNWSQYLEGLYQPMQSEESIHVRFVNHERTFKFWLRNDGRCWWRSALTPKNSTNTLSPFVILQTRS